MKRAGGLFARIVSFENLLAAERRAARGKLDRACVARFEFHLERELIALQEALQEGTYRTGGFCIRRGPPRIDFILDFLAVGSHRTLRHCACNVSAYNVLYVK